MTKRLKGLGGLVGVALLIGGCATGKAMHTGDEAMRLGNLDQAVDAYRAAVQADPDNAKAKIALERAMQAASRFHLDRAHQFEQQGQIEAALGEYKLASENDPSNRGIAAKIAQLDREIRDRAEAARPKPAGQQARERARTASTQPILNPAVDRLNINFTNVQFKDILNFIASASGINVSYDRDVVDRMTTLQINDVLVEQAIIQVLTMNQLSYKVVNDKSIFVFPDNTQKHTQYDEQVIKTFFIQYADATELTQMLSNVMRIANMAIQPAITANRTTNTITVRASTAIMQIIDRVIDQNDKPRAEVVFDIEILEVDRDRAKSYGLNLTEFAVGTVLSPEVSPNGTTTTTGTGNGNAGTATGPRSTAPSAIAPPPPFNLNTISRGLSTADFYLAVPAAIVRFLESDTRSKLLAKPQIRGAQGNKISLNLGQEVPIVSTSYTPIATGGVGVNPLNSFQLKPVGIVMELTPTQVTMDGDILLDLSLESSAQGPDQNVAGANYPSFVTRKVGTRLRLRDGESNLLAGLLREDEANSIQGFPGAIRVPVLKQAFSSNNSKKSQIDLIMLLTPHIVRTSEITDQDLRPIFIGSQQNLGLGGGPPPLIAPPPADNAATPAPANAPRVPAPTPAPGTPTPGTPTTPPTPGATLAPPPGSTPVPGLVVVPPAPTPTPPAVTQPAPAPPPATPEPPAAGTPLGSAQVIISPPSGTFRVGQGPVHRRAVGARRRPAFDRRAHVDVRSDAPASPRRAGGQLHAARRRRRDVHAAGRARPCGHHDYTIWRRHRRDRNRTAGRRGLRTGCGGNGHADAERFGNRSGRNGHEPPVPASDGHDPAMKVAGLRRAGSNRSAGYTFVELIIVSSIIMILASAVMPLARVTATRQREAELRRALREMRTAIDKFKDAADTGMIGSLEIKAGSEGYPADLETLVEGVAAANDATGRKLKFLRKVPIDPMTRGTDWGLRSYQDKADATRWGGQNVFDIYTTFGGTALDGTKYRLVGWLRLRITAFAASPASR